MAPLMDFECVRCHMLFDGLVRNEKEFEETRCPQCAHDVLQVRFTAPANYTIKGDNSASTRPKKSRSTAG